MLDNTQYSTALVISYSNMCLPWEFGKMCGSTPYDAFLNDIFRKTPTGNTTVCLL